MKSPIFLFVQPGNREDPHQRCISRQVCPCFTTLPRQGTIALYGRVAFL